LLEALIHSHTRVEVRAASRPLRRILLPSVLVKSSHSGRMSAFVPIAQVESRRALPGSQGEHVGRKERPDLGAGRVAVDQGERAAATNRPREMLRGRTGRSGRPRSSLPQFRQRPWMLASR
jgi:hypothetical protein